MYKPTLNNMLQNMQCEISSSPCNPNNSCGFNSAISHKPVSTKPMASQPDFANEGSSSV